MDFHENDNSRHIVSFYFDFKQCYSETGNKLAEKGQPSVFLTLYYYMK